ncbi:hypothetical protein BHE74_00038520 [Ensete ventricosum]|nr:hypothetical protein BHE74_00038520 [Ensete ventricosum]
MAEQSSWNYLGIFKISNISGKKRELVPVSNADNDVDMDSESSSDEDDDDDEDEKSSQPVLHVSNLFHLHKVAHQGCVNRIRSMIQRPHICATWADTGHVQVKADVFASCSVDGTIAIWDTRLGNFPCFYFIIRLASCMIASGSDDGTFSIRDLRLIKLFIIQGDALVAHFEYHKQPITSIEWSPHEASTLAVASEDNQLT